MKFQIPEQIPDQIETERLLLRCPRAGDGAAVYAAIQESLPELRPWIRWSLNPLTPESAEADAQEGQAQFQARERFPFLIFLKEDQTFAGGITIKDPNWTVPSFELGGWIRSGYARRGLMTEALVGVTDFAFRWLDARRVAWVCDAKNQPSAAVARRAGFEFEGRLRCQERNHLTAELVDALFFSRIRLDEDASLPSRD